MECNCPNDIVVSFFGLMRCAIQNTGSVYLVLGKPKIPVLFSVGRLLILIPALVLLVPEGGMVRHLLSWALQQ